jgi:hypothetical protein
VLLMLSISAFFFSLFRAHLEYYNDHYMRIRISITINKRSYNRINIIIHLFSDNIRIAS